MFPRKVPQSGQFLSNLVGPLNSEQNPGTLLAPNSSILALSQSPQDSTTLFVLDVSKLEASPLCGMFRGLGTWGEEAGKLPAQILS